MICSWIPVISTKSSLPGMAGNPGEQLPGLESSASGLQYQTIPNPQFSL